ncbi:MAG: hypothetical protein ACREJ5_18765, partial [Geminicoccaceae bacterium]
LAGAKAAERALAVSVGTLIYGLAGLLLAEAWRQLLGPGAAGADPWRERALYGRTQIAKYLPGNCFHLVGRQVLGKRLGHGHGPLVLASLGEAASLLLVAGALALPLVWSELERTLGMAPGWLVLATAGLVAVVIGLNGRRVGAWRARLALHAGGPPIGAWAPRVLRAGLLHAAFFVVAGLVLWGVAAAIRDPAAPGLGPTAAVSSMAMAWWLGFVAPGSSAGVGVREAVLVLLLEPHLGSDGAMLAALALRLITTLGDLLFFGLCAVVPWDAATDQDARHANRQPLPPILK